MSVMAANPELFSRLPVIGGDEEAAFVIGIFTRHAEQDPATAPGTEPTGRAAVQRGHPGH